MIRVLAAIALIKGVLQQLRKKSQHKKEAGHDHAMPKLQTTTTSAPRGASTARPL